MTDLNCENRELRIDELRTEDLDLASGGRMKLPKSDAQKAWEIAQIERDNPGF